MPMTETSNSHSGRTFSVPQTHQDRSARPESDAKNGGDPAAAAQPERRVSLILERKGREVAHVDADASVLEAAKIMNERRIGALVVADGERVIGMFTERDILNRVVAAQKDPAATAVRSVMSSPMTVCQGDTTLDECRVVMRSKRIRHLPVVENDVLVGIISIGDLNEAENAHKDETILWMQEYMFGNYR